MNLFGQIQHYMDLLRQFEIYMFHIILLQGFNIIQISQNRLMLTIRNIKQQAQKVSTDLYLLQQYSQFSHKSESASPNLSNMSALGNLLKQKNSRYNYSKEQRQRDQTWVINKRGDLKPLLKRVQEIKIKSQTNHDQKMKELTSEFYINPTGLENQNKFIQKSLQYFVFSTVQYSLGIDNHRNNRTHKKKRLKQLNFEFSHKVYNQGIKYTKNTKKLEDYLKAVQQLFLNNQRMECRYWVATFKSITKLKLWEIISNLISTNQKDAEGYPEISLYEMALSSLKMVQSEFNAMLPSNYQSLLYYLTANYLRKLQGKYKSEGSLGPIWGICYLLYKAGRKKQFYQYLPDAEMRNKFQIVDQSIATQKPKKIIENQLNHDVFHDQLIYALQGVSKFSSDVLCDPDSLDIAWVFLRNVAIFPKQQMKFISLQKQILKSYRNTNLNESRVKNLLYLLCFEELVECGPNQMIDQDDYLHFLIALYHSPELIKVCKAKDNKIERKLTQKLAQFIQKLLCEERKQAIYYIALMPYQNLPNEISSLMSSLKLLQKFKWNELTKYLPRRIYEDLVNQTCQKHAQINNDYLTAAQKELQILNDSQLALQLVIKMLILATTSNRFEDHILRRGQNLAKKIINQNERLDIEYGPVFQFFKQHRQLIKLISQRKEQRIYPFLKNCKHILISEQIRVSTQSVIQKLMKNEKNGFDCYVSYMKDVVRAYQIALTKMGKIYELQQLQRLTLNALIGIQNQPMYNKYAKKQSILSLIRILEESLFNNI